MTDTVVDEQVADETPVEVTQPEPDNDEDEGKGTE